MKTEGHREIVGVEIVGSISYDTTTGLYNNQRKYLEQWNPWYSYWSIYNLNQAQLFPKQRNMWIDHGLSPGMDNFELEWFQLADALQKLLSEVDISFGNYCWVEAYLFILRKLYNLDIFTCLHVLLSHYLFQVHLDFQLIYLADLKRYHIDGNINMGGWWWDTQDQLCAGVMIVPVIKVSNNTHLNNCSRDQRIWRLYLVIRNIRTNTNPSPWSWALSHVRQILYPAPAANNADEA